MHEGVFNLNNNTSLYVDKEFMNAGEFLVNYIENGSAFKLKKSSEEKAAVVIKKNDTLSPEGYTLKVLGSEILIDANDASGAFYAIQTLRQLMPLQLEKNNGFQEKTISINFINCSKRFTEILSVLTFSSTNFCIIIN